MFNNLFNNLRQSVKTNYFSIIAQKINLVNMSPVKVTRKVFYYLSPFMRAIS